VCSYFKSFQFLNCLAADRDIYFNETASNIIIIIIIIIIINVPKSVEKSQGGKVTILWN